MASNMYRFGFRNVVVKKFFGTDDFLHHITKIRLFDFDFDPLKSHFYIVKLGFTNRCVGLSTSAHFHQAYNCLLQLQDKKKRLSSWHILSDILSSNFLVFITRHLLSSDVAHILVFFFTPIPFESLFVSRYIQYIPVSGRYRSTS